jgi:hypothetical protein
MKKVQKMVVKAHLKPQGADDAGYSAQIGSDGNAGQTENEP